MNKRFNCAKIKIKNDKIEYIEISKLDQNQQNICDIGGIKNTDTSIVKNSLFLTGLSNCIFDSTSEIYDILNSDKDVNLNFDSTSADDLNTGINPENEFFSDFDTSSDFGEININECGIGYTVDDNGCFLNFEGDNPSKYSSEVYNNNLYLGLYTTGELLKLDLMVENGEWEDLSDTLPYSIYTHDNHILFLKTFNGYLFLGLRNGELYRFKNNIWNKVKTISGMRDSESTNSEMIITTENGLIFIFNKIKWRNVVIENQKRISCITTINDAAFLSIRNRLYEYDYYTRKVKEFPLNEIIISLKKYRDVIYITTYDNYIYRMYLFDFEEAILIKIFNNKEELLTEYNDYLYSLYDQRIIKKFSHIKKINIMNNLINDIGRTYI